MDAPEKYVGVKSAGLGEELAMVGRVSSLRLAEWEGGCGQNCAQTGSPGEGPD